MHLQFSLMNFDLKRYSLSLLFTVPRLRCRSLCFISKNVSAQVYVTTRYFFTARYFLSCIHFKNWIRFKIDAFLVNKKLLCSTWNFLATNAMHDQKINLSLLLISNFRRKLDFSKYTCVSENLFYFWLLLNYFQASERKMHISLNCLFPPRPALLAWNSIFPNKRGKEPFSHE